MNDETLLHGNRLRNEIEGVKNMLRLIENNKKQPVVEITFNNGGYGCCSIHSNYLSVEEVEAIKANITEQIHLRAQARLAELQKEFDNL